MKKSVICLLTAAILCGCALSRTDKSGPLAIVASLDLADVRDDKVQVTVDPGNLNSESIRFFLPQTVPGTYSEDNYGRFIEEFKAFDHSGNLLEVQKQGENSWTITNAKALDRITYLVNDTYDLEGEADVFSPTGTNIEAGRNFMLNLHGFVGYFEGLQEAAYRLEIKRPSHLYPGTAAQLISTTANQEASTDIFQLKRYFEVTDNPIMYALPDTASFRLGGMEVLLHVHSPNKKYSAADLFPAMKEMITAQKSFLGEIDNTEKYAILLYLSDSTKVDAAGSGALEHHTSTVVNFPETMAPERLEQSMVDVVSHEFFHILTPLNVHSEEVHSFNYNAPEMSRHLWMYEGATEYFAHLFQINQGLIGEETFYDRLLDKIEVAGNYDETVPFTLMSRNILQPEYNETFYNVYHKGALIAMALDIRLRELSNGESGLLDLMKQLSQKYGKDLPFQDEQLLEEITALTYPEIADFFDTYVQGPTPLAYVEFFEKVGLKLVEDSLETGYLVKGKLPYVDLNSETGDIYFRKRIGYNSFLKELGAEGGDIIKEINGTALTPGNAGAILRESLTWKPGMQVKMTVERKGQELELQTIAGVPTEKIQRLIVKDLPETHPAVQLRKTWLFQ